MTDLLTAVVEDVADPLGIGRVKVRVPSHHSNDLNDVKTSDLPWAMCLYPVVGGALGGVSGGSTGLLVGSWVTGYYRDPDDNQDFVIVGSYATGGEAVGGAGNFGPVAYGNGGVYGDQTGLNQPAEDDPAYIAPGDVGLTSDIAQNIVNVAKSQGGVRETPPGSNRHPNIKQYWSATNSPGTYPNAYCAAFVCWVCQQAGVPDAVRPKGTATGVGKTANVNSSVLSHCKNHPKIYTHIAPNNIKAGDIVWCTYSHIMIAAGPPGRGRLPVITANSAIPSGGTGVAIKTYSMGSISQGMRVMSGAPPSGLPTKSS